MQSIRENTLKRIGKKGKFLLELNVLPPEIQRIIDGVANLNAAEDAGKESRDKNWDKVELIEMILDRLLTMAKDSFSCDGCNECDDKIQKIDELLGMDADTNPQSLENINPIGEC